MRWTNGLVLFGVVGSLLAAAPAFADTAEPPVILQMANGQFYAPASGKTAATREELLTLLGQPVPPASSGTRSPEPGAQPSPLLAAVDRARLQLQEAINADEAKLTKLRISKTEATSRPVTIAVWNKVTDEIVTVDAVKQGMALKRTAGPDLGLKVAYTSGAYSSYSVRDPNQVVVAVRYPYYEDHSNGKNKSFEIHDVVYTPNSPGLITPEMVAAGRQTLDGLIAEALSALDARGVRSAAFPEKPISQVIDANAVKAVIVIEHADDLDLKLRPTSTMDKIYTAFAANRERTFAYTESKAGARGLVQFMPTSYDRFAKRRPELGLDADFERGMQDGRNAIKAEAAYLDYLLTSMPDDALATFGDQKEQLYEFAVASYNAGPSRVVKALSQWDKLWDGQEELRQKQIAALTAKVEPMRKKILAEDDPKVWKPLQRDLNNLRAQIKSLQAKQTTPPLKKETLEYLKKYRAVMPFLLSEAADGTA